MKQALYRIYRPKSFDEIYGQDQIISILKNQLQTNSLSHAYLFCGPRGTGKTSTAKVFASNINNGTDVDTIELDAASNNSVDNIREIRDNLAFAPSLGKYKIYIIDEVHMLSTSAFNALLKTLEEPPSHIIFILATTEPQKIPQTVLSRCQRFDFKKIDNLTLIKRLEEVLENEGVSYEMPALEFIAQKSEGGLRDALSLLDKALAYGSLSMDNILEALGEISADSFLLMLKAIHTKDTALAVTTLGKIEASGMDSKVFVLDFINFLKKIILHINGISQNDELITKCIEFCDDKKAAYIIEDLSLAHSQMRYSPNPQVLLLSEIVRIVNTNYEGIGKSKALQDQLKSEFAFQNAEITRLQGIVEKLQTELLELKTNPQFFVDNSNSNVDNSKKANTANVSQAKNSSEKEALSTGNSVPKVNSAAIERVEVSEEEKRELEIIKDAIPVLFEELRAVKQVQLQALIREGQVERFVNNNIFFCFEEKNIFHKNMLETHDPQNLISKILSKLLKKNVATQYILYSELSKINSEKKPKEQDLLDELNKNFPEAKIEVKP